MPYKSLNDLPESVRRNLPEHAQKIYLEAFNNAWDQYAKPEDRKGDDHRADLHGQWAAAGGGADALHGRKPP